jgi:hypothetical protein
VKAILRFVVLAALPAVSALSLVSCYVDPFGSVGGTYYGGGGSTSVFVSTGDPQWGYDPYRYCYYDYYRRSYYDPYLCGYYPVGFLQVPVYGCPHPHGWNPGHGNCPPPGSINDRWIDRYHDRVGAIKASNYAWASKVRANNQAMAQTVHNNNAAWANKVTNSRQLAIQNQRNTNQSIRDNQQAWADKVRANRQNQANALHSGGGNGTQVYGYHNPQYQKSGGQGGGGNGMNQWADKVRDQRDEHQAAKQFNPAPKGYGGGGQGGGGNQGGGQGGKKADKWADKLGTKDG